MKASKTVTLTCSTGSLSFTFPTSSLGRSSKRVFPKASTIDLDQAKFVLLIDYPVLRLVDAEYVFDRFPGIHKYGYLEFSADVLKTNSPLVDFLDESQKPPDGDKWDYKLIHQNGRFYWSYESPHRAPGTDPASGDWRDVIVPIDHTHMLGMTWIYTSGTAEMSDPDWLNRARSLTDQIIGSIKWTPREAAP